MYSISHIESSFNNITYIKMDSKDFENYIIIHDAIKRFEEIDLIKKIAIKNSLDVLLYIKKITRKLNNNFKISHQEIHEISIEYIIRATLLNQTFIENLKTYCKDLKPQQKTQIENYIKENKKLQFLRLLRNYTYHSTIPIDTSIMIWDVILKEYKDIKVILMKNTLINNLKTSGKDRQFIDMLENDFKEEINLIDLFDDWIKEIHVLYELILKFLSENLKENIKIFNDKFYNIFTSTNGYVTDFHDDRTYTSYIINKDIFMNLI